MFADIRGFTALSEGRLPYDVVFMLNRYFAAMGRAVESTGGRVDKFLGDGVMALFGIDSGAEDGLPRGARRRPADVAAAGRAEHVADRRNRPAAAHRHRHPCRADDRRRDGLWRRPSSITAIGDAVNTASRLEELTKEYGCELVVSETVVARAGVDLSAFPSHEIEIRGKREKLAVRTLPSAADLPASGAAPIRAPEPAAAAQRSSRALPHS